MDAESGISGIRRRREAGIARAASSSAPTTGIRADSIDNFPSQAAALAAALPGIERQKWHGSCSLMPPTRKKRVS